LMSSYPAITKDRIVGHSDVAPGRKTDPGDSFDWSRVR
jgi:AmpD protein